MYLTDGYQTLISLAVNPAIKLREISVTPPGLEGGDAIDTTTMRNNLMKTKAPQYLVELLPVAFVAEYDPALHPNAISVVINVNTLVTLTWPDGAASQFWGYLRNVVFNENVIGERPTLNGEIVPTCRDANGTETNPVFIAP